MKKYFLLLMVGVIALSLTGCALKTVDDGQTGVKADFGKFAVEPLRTGWHWYIPGITWVEVWNVKTRELKETATVPSSEGLISTLDVSLLYNVPIDKAVFVRKTVGSDFERTIVEPYFREAIRNVASGYEVKSLYSEEGRGKIGEQILKFLKAKLEPRGIIVQDVLLRDVRLPAAFSDSIQQKLRTEQESLQKQFELTKAEKDAEIAVAKAKGIAESNKIIAGSISENYLRYLWVESLQNSEKQIVYIPTEANLPIMEAGRWKDIKEGKK